MTRETEQKHAQLIAAPAGKRMHDDYSQSWAVGTLDGNLIAGLFWDQMGGDTAAERYARLFAASEEMLEACQNALAAGLPSEVAASVRAAISKATGA